MKKIRCFLAALALVLTLSGPSFLDSGGTAITVSLLHARSLNASSVIARSFRLMPIKPHPSCPIPGHDC